MKTQDNYYDPDLVVEIRPLIFRRGILKYISPVKIQKITLILDMFAWTIVTRESGLDFSQVDEMVLDEYFTWVIYGGHVSYQATKHRKSKYSVTKVEEFVQGLLQADRERILDVITRSRQIGEKGEQYQEAMAKMVDSQEDDEGKKLTGSDHKS